MWQRHSDGYFKLAVYRIECVSYQDQTARLFFPFFYDVWVELKVLSVLPYTKRNIIRRWWHATKRPRSTLFQRKRKWRSPDGEREKAMPKASGTYTFLYPIDLFSLSQSSYKEEGFFFVEELASKKRQFTFFVTHCNLSIWKFFLKSHAVDILNAISPIIESTTTRRRWSQKITPLFY